MRNLRVKKTVRYIAKKNKQTNKQTNKNTEPQSNSAYTKNARISTAFISTRIGSRTNATLKTNPSRRSPREQVIHMEAQAQMHLNAHDARRRAQNNEHRHANFT